MLRKEPSQEFDHLQGFCKLQQLGNDLTSQEERILAYTHYAAGEQAVRMKVGPDTETGE
jgi:hypothetical protein